MSDAGWIEIAHCRVGTIRLPESAVIRFAGLPGFPEARCFALVHHDEDSPFSWLACLDDPELAFVVTDPRLFFPSYGPAIPPRVLEAVGAENPGEVELLTIANLGGERPRLNLAAPLVVNAVSRRATQAVLDDDALSVSHAIPAAAPAPAPEAQMESKPHR